MKFSHRSVKFIAALIAGVALVACANQMEPAKKLVGDVEAAVTAAGADAQQYVPDQVASVTQKVADLKAAFEKQDYKTVIATAPGLLTEAKGLADAAAAKKKEVMEAMGGQWTALAASLPQSVSGIEAKLASLATMKKLPAGITKDGVESAKSGLAEAKTAWDEAKTAFGSGDVKSAIDKASALKTKIAEIASKIGIADAAPAA